MALLHGGGAFEGTHEESTLGPLIETGPSWLTDDPENAFIRKLSNLLDVFHTLALYKSLPQLTQTPFFCLLYHMRS